jgi:hypothetical protein
MGNKLWGNNIVGEMPIRRNEIQVRKVSLIKPVERTDRPWVTDSYKEINKLVSTGHYTSLKKSCSEKALMNIKREAGFVFKFLYSSPKQLLAPRPSTVRNTRCGGDNPGSGDICRPTNRPGFRSA